MQRNHVEPDRQPEAESDDIRSPHRPDLAPKFDRRAATIKQEDDHSMTGESARSGMTDEEQFSG